MSKFVTIIPADIEAVRKLLPPGSYILPPRLGEDKKSIVIEWEHDDWRTPYSIPVEVSAAMLAGTEPLPDPVKPKGGWQKVQNDTLAKAVAGKVKLSK